MKVKVLCSAVIYKGKNYPKGKIFEAEPKDVKSLLKEKLLEEVKEPKAKKEEK